MAVAQSRSRESVLRVEDSRSMSIRRSRATSAALAAFLAACFNHGTRPENFRPAQGAAGARVALRVQGEASDRVGELIAVDSVGVTIRERQLVEIAWRRVAALDVAQLGDDYDIHFGESVSPEKRARLALVSRFPQGLSHLPLTIDSLIAATARSVPRFGSRRAAVDAGYQRVGFDFPGMGEHWLNTTLMLGGDVDPGHPTFLIYADIRGRPTLLGAGFAIVTRGDSMPHDLPGWPEHWHEHSGLLADESGARTDTAHVEARTRLWVMHVWTELANPDGPTAADNWALPYLRAGRVIPEHVDASAGRALSLASGGDVFLRDLLTDAGVRTPASAAAIDSALTRARARLTPAATDNDLSETWRKLCDDLAKVAGQRAVTLLQPAHASHAHGAER
jgi:hypothetical protein